MQSAFKVAIATAGFALLHSLLASGAAKRTAERVLGRRCRNAIYRPAYNLLAVGTSAALVYYIRQQPSRTLYEVRQPAAGLMRLGQVAALAGLGNAAWQIGPLAFSGLPNLWAWLKGQAEIPPEPEGQSPPPTSNDQFEPGGVFRVARHPANLFPIPLLWLNPRMTTTVAAFNSVATLYFVLGSLHSDRRLFVAYGRKYEQYCQEVPLFLPHQIGPRLVSR